jgi:hypothetical protein
MHLTELPGNGNHRGLQETPLKLKVHPNPLNPKADINFTLVDAGHVRSRSMISRDGLVKTILDENRNAGDHAVSWDGTSDRTGRVYFRRVLPEGHGEAGRGHAAREPCSVEEDQGLPSGLAERYGAAEREFRPPFVDQLGIGGSGKSGTKFRSGPYKPSLAPGHRVNLDTPPRTQ